MSKNDIDLTKGMVTEFRFFCGGPYFDLSLTEYKETLAIEDMNPWH